MPRATGGGTLHVASMLRWSRRSFCARIRGVVCQDWTGLVVLSFYGDPVWHQWTGRVGAPSEDKLVWHCVICCEVVLADHDDAVAHEMDVVWAMD